MSSSQEEDQHGDEDGQIPFESALADLVDNAALSDLALKGSDGAIVHANRCILAARSKVFRAMLYGDFCEREKATIELEYEGAVLRCIVGYCCTNKVNHLCLDATNARSVVSLVNASDFFLLPSLAKEVILWATTNIEKQPSLAWLFLEVSASNSRFPDTIASQVTTTIRTKLPQILDEEVLQHVSPGVIEGVLKDEHVTSNEQTKFQLLQTWAKGSCDRKEAAAGLSKHLRLRYINASVLSKAVASSGLVKETQLLDAFQKQALMAEEGRNVYLRSAIVVQKFTWSSSDSKSFTCQTSSHSVEKLHCTPLDSGIHTWSIKLTKACEFSWMGVVSNVHNLDLNDWLGKQSGGWVYGSNGAACHATYQDNGPYNTVYPEFNEGKIITFTLDLTGNGTLSAKIGEGRDVELFCNMFAAFAEGQQAAFVPAVSLRTPGQVEFIAMKSKS